MSEKVIVHVAYPLWRKNALVALARARELQDAGDDVTVTYCDSSSGTCAVNFMGSPVTCAICRSSVRKSATALGLPLVSLSGDPQPDSSKQLSTGEKKDLLEGVRSGLISAFRMLPSDLRSHSLTRKIKQRYWQTSMALLISIKELVRQKGAARIEVFNGRHGCSRFCLIAAEQYGIPYNTLEVSHSGRPITFVGHRPHDRIRIQERILRQDADMQLAKTYFDRRRTPAANRYAKHHNKNFTPPKASTTNQRITVFLSSQDEFESLGKQWRSQFSDYASVIRKMAKALPNSFFCIRFHPNQADISSDITSAFQDIEQLPNTQIYYASDTVNSYELVDWSDAVVTFGSTIALEACWMGKPSFILGPSYYDQLDVSYTPQSVEELIEQLNGELHPGNAENAAKFAVFAVTEGDDYQYITMETGKMKPQGFRQRNMVLTRLARYFDNIACNVIKSTLSRKNANHRKAA